MLPTNIGDRVRFALIPYDDSISHGKVNDFLFENRDWVIGKPVPFFDSTGRAYVWVYAVNPQFDTEQAVTQMRATLATKREVLQLHHEIRVNDLVTEAKARQAAERNLTGGVQPVSADQLKGPRMMPS